jgi:hypothetical protein
LLLCGENPMTPSKKEEILLEMITKFRKIARHKITIKINSVAIHH